MAGHNKWSKIKHKKAATDARKSKIFGKLVRLISSEAKKAGGDREAPGLRQAIEKAKKENMPMDNIERAIKKANESPDNLEENMYETYGPGGVGIIITALTDNNNRTAAEIKHVLSQHNASLGTPGSVSWNFTKDGGDWVPQTTIPMSDEDEAKLDALIEALEDIDDVQDMYTNRPVE